MGDRKAPGNKENLKKFKEEIVHQFHVISEDVISQVLAGFGKVPKLGLLVPS